jgi:hypothetical protein
VQAALAVALIAAFPGNDLTQLSDAPAGNPAISQDKRFGRLVAFEAGGNVFGVHRAEPTNGVRDAMLATEPSGDRWLLGESGSGGPTTNPMTSPHGNHVVFQRGGTVHVLYVGEK